MIVYDLVETWKQENNITVTDSELSINQENKNTRQLDFQNF